MIELTVKISLNGSDINEAEKWLEELAENEMFQFEIIESTTI